MKLIESMKEKKLDMMIVEWENIFQTLCFSCKNNHRETHETCQSEIQWKLKLQ